MKLGLVFGVSGLPMNERAGYAYSEMFVKHQRYKTFQPVPGKNYNVFAHNVDPPQHAQYWKALIFCVIMRFIRDFFLLMLRFIQSFTCIQSLKTPNI